MRLEVLEDRNLLSFSSITSYGAGLSPRAVALGDFNNDTRLDLAVVNYADNSVSVLLAKSDGTFGPAVNASTGAGPVSLAVGDFNGDGKLDIATANSTDISVLLGNGDGTTQAALSVVLPGEIPPGASGDTALFQYPISLAVGDFNADGKLDFAVTGNTSYYYTYTYANVLLGHGDGNFTSSDAKLLDGTTPGSVAVADFNGDGKLDLAMGNSLATILLGNGDGTLQAPVSFAATGAGSVAVGDFNGDGKPDLAIAGIGGVSVLLGNGDGTLQAAKINYIPNPTSVAVGDINADGKLDLVATSSIFVCTSYGYYGCYGGLYEGFVNVLLGYGDGNFAAAQTTTLPSGRPFGVALGKLDGDGLIDAATANNNTNDATVLINAGDFVLPPPTLSINDVTVTEGNIGTVNAVFTVNLSAAWDQTVTVHYSTADNTATTAGNDYQTKSGTLTFAPGVTSQTIPVLVNGDNVSELDETFFVNLDSPTVASIARGQGVATILDDEPDITITDVSGTEGNSGTTNFVFTVSLSASYDQTATVHYSTVNGTATAGIDYTATSGTVTFLAGETSHTVTVAVTGDRVPESDETFFVNLDNASSNASLADAQGVGTILDDEPRITINDVSLNEGNSGTTKFNFTVSLSAAYDASVTVSYATADGTAKVANRDYQSKSGTVIFAAGVTSQTITVLVNGDRKKESDETFYVNLSSPSSNALIADTQGVGTIVNDDSGKGKASTAAAPIASDVEDISAALVAPGRPSPNVPAASSAVVPSRQASAVDQVFAVIGGQAQWINPDHTKGHARTTDPWTYLFSNHGWLWNESVPGEIVF